VRAALDRLAAVLVLPLRAAHHAGALGFSTGSQMLSLIPGQLGKFLRRAWYAAELEQCGRDLVIDFGAAIRTKQTRLGDHVYIGLHNWIGLVELGDDFMSGSHVVILSGGRTHGFGDLSKPMRLQEVVHTRTHIGPDVWVGTGAKIMADVAAHSVVAAGAVVTRTHEPYEILAGVPAQRIGSRLEHAAAETTGA
jgi:acetyltransferase-like isoleucine patch superfamily enzyme